MLRVPVFVIVTKVDIATRAQLQNTLNTLVQLLRSPGVDKLPFIVRSENDFGSCTSTWTRRGPEVPIFLVSNVTGTNIDLLQQFFSTLPKPTKQYHKLLEEPVEFQIEKVYTIPDVGLVVGGMLQKGRINIHDKMQSYNLGPDNKGNFIKVQVSSIHKHRSRFFLLLLFLQLVFAQSNTNLDYDPPEPYVTHPVNYTGDFETLHEELERPLNGKVREYYIAAEEVIWDYAQHSGNVAEDQAVHFWIASGPTSIGSRYYKAIYREYTDASYSTTKPRPQWQGLLGPVLRAEVGDTIKVHFYNKASHKFSIHPHGVFYEFEMEGAVYKDATEFSSVAPGGNYTYTWQVYPRAGPGPNDGDSIVWGYHSHVSENDIYAGLFGPIVIYKTGTMDQDHISKEIITAILGFNENISPYLPQTLAQLAPQIDFDAVKSNRSAHALFRRANIKQSVNGLISSHPEDLVLEADTIYQWHVLGWGSVKDLHTITWQQGQVTLFDQPIRQIRLMPASFRTLQFKIDEPGSWQFGYLYGESAIEGMIMWYKVMDRHEQE